MFGRAASRLTGGVAVAALLAAAPSQAAAQVDLVLNVTDTPDPVPATGTVTYAVRVNNVGASLATGVSYVMTVPSGAVYRGFSAGSGASCSGMAVNAAGPGTVTCSHPSIAAADSGTFSLQLRLNTQGSTVVPSTVSSAQVDADTDDNSVSNQTTVSSGADFGVTLTAPATLASGTTFSYALAVTNAGPDPASLVRIAFPVPAGFTQSGGLPSGCSLSAGTITCNVSGPIASGATFTVGSIPGKVTAGSGSTVTGTATIALQPGAPLSTPQDPNTANNTAVSNITVTAGSDLRLTKTRSVGGPYFVGGTFNFVLTAAYDGDAPSTLTLRDTMPANYTVGAVAASQNGWTCSVSGQVVTCTRPSGGTAGANQSLGSVTIPVTIASAGSGIVNTARISAASPTDPDPSNNVATDGGATLLLPTADLAIAKTGPNPALAVIGVPFNWTLTASNAGPSLFTGTLIVADTIPAGINITQITQTGWTCDQTAPVSGPTTLTCSRIYTGGSPLASGASAPTITLRAEGSVAGTVINRASVGSSGANVSDPNAANNGASHSMSISTAGASADIQALKTVDLGTVPAGEVLTYTLQVANLGPVTSTNVTLTDDLLTLINNGVGATGQGYVGHTVTSIGVASAVNCSSATNGTTGRRLTCTIPSLPVCTAGVNCPTITVAIRPGGNGGSRTNTASVISSTIADSNGVNNSASATNTVDPRADVTVSTTDNPDPVAAGQNLTYVVTALNNGPSAGANVTITDSLPLNVRFISATPSAGSCSVTPTVNSITSSGNRRVVCDLGTINNAAQRTVTIVVRPTTPTRGTSIENVADVTTSTVEPAVHATNRSTITTAVANPSLDLLINKVDSVDPVTIGSNTVYTITVSNIGPSDAENVVVRDTLPLGGLTFQSVAAGPYTCSAVPALNALGGELVCSISRIAAGGSAALDVTMQAITKGVYSNRARVTSDEIIGGFDVDALNNVAVQATSIRTRADIDIVSKVASVATIALRRPYTWTIRLRNNTGAGLAEADSVRITDNLPATMELTGTPSIVVTNGTTTENSCTGSVGQTSFTCTLGTVSNGGDMLLTVPVRHTSVPSGGTTTNTVTATTSSFDPILSNNSRTSAAITVTSSSISGTVFRDFDNDAALDAGDTGINAIGMTITGTAFDGAPVSASAPTNTSGVFTISGLPEGTYTLQRGTVSEAFLAVGTQTAGTSGGTAGTPPNISAISLGQAIAATDYRFAFIPTARIGLAKRVIGTTTANPDGSLTTTLRIRVQNYSLEALSGVAVNDALAGAAPQFGTFVSGGSGAVLTANTYTVNTAPATVGACVGATPNAGFNGSGTPLLAAITTLATGAACEFDFTLRYRPSDPLPGGNYTNQASGTGTGALSGQTPSDLSQNGTTADPNGDNDPTNDNAPTPLNAFLAADVTTVVSLPGSAAAGTLVSGTVLYTNNGPYSANGVTYTLQLSPSLSGVIFSNLPTGAVAVYASGTGVVTFAGMPTTLTPGQIASGNGTTAIGVRYTQNGIANTAVSSSIATSTNEGPNTAPNSSAATVTGPLVADVTTTVTYPASVNAGQAVNGVVVFRNLGPSTASGMSYGITLTPGLTGVTFGNLPGGAGASYASGTGLVTFTGMPATLVSGAIASGNGTSGITLNWTQNPVANSAINTSISTTTGQGANTAPDAATAAVVGVPIADVRTALSFPVTANAGDPVSGTVLFTNDGPSTADATTFSLVLSPGLTGVSFVNLPGGVTATYNSVTGVVAFTGMPTSLAAGQVVSGNATTPITVTYVQGPSGVSTINSTIATSTNQGANVGLDAAVASPGGVPVADVRTVITAPASVNAGEPVSTVVTYSNNGPSDAAGVGYSLTLSAGLSNVVFGNLPAGAAASYNSATGTVTFTAMPATLTVGAIASGNGTSGITVSYTQNAVASSTINGGITTTTDQGANIAPDTDSKTVTGALIADVTTALQGFPVIAPPGSPVNGTLTFRNAGPSAASGMTYALTMATGLSGVTLGNLPGGATATYDQNSGVVTFTGMPNSVAPTAIVSGNGTSGITVSYAQSNALESVLESVIGTSTSQGVNALTDNARVVISGIQGTDLVVRKTTTVSEVTPRDTITYTIAAQNNGPVALDAGTVLTDSPIAGLSLVSASCSALGGNLCSAAPSSSQLLSGVSLPAMPVGAIWEITVRAAVTAPDGAVVTNAAQADVPFGFFDTDSTNNRAVAGPIVVRARPDLAITKSIDVDTLRVGGQATYTAVIVNRGTSTTTGPITITETLPAALVPRTATGAGFTCSIAGQTVTCTRTTPMALLDSARITIGTTVSAAAPQAPVATTVCTRTQDDINLPNDCASVLTPVVGRLEAGLRKEAVGEFIVGEPGVYRLWVRNSGTVPLTGPITVVDSLPSGLSYLSAQGTNWTCTNANGVITCAQSSPIAVGDSSLVTLTTMVGRDAVPQVTNCATLSVDGGAVLTANGRSCATTQTRGDYRLVLELSTPRYDRELQDVPDFTVTVRNVGRSPLPDVMLTNLLPRGFTYVPGTSARGGAPELIARGTAADPTVSGSSITWPLGNLAAGAVARMDYRALIGIGATFNTDNITISSAQSSVIGLQVLSNTARVPIRLRRGLFDNRGMISGKVYIDCNCARTPGQGDGELGIPGVRVLMEDGTGAITDVEGKYNFVNVRAGLHVVKVDRNTLPAGATLVTLNTRNAGDAYSRFVDLKAGELQRADFAEGSRSGEVLQQVIARRRAGEVNAAAESARLSAALDRPMLQGQAQRGMTQAPVLGAENGASRVVAASVGTTYVPLVAADQLHDGNSALPVTPERARTQFDGLANTTGTGRIILEIPSTAVPADGRRVLPVTVRVLDSTGAPARGSIAVTLEASAGGWRGMDGDPTAKGMQVVVTNGVGQFDLVTPRLPVVAQVRATSPVAMTTKNVTFTPEEPSFTAIGLLQGRIDLRSLSRGSLNLATSADAFEESLNDMRLTRDSGEVRAGARGALLMKGNVKGAGVLTLAYDTERDRDRTQFRDITPDEGFQVFGDGSLREFDAQSQQRLYARLDRGNSFVRYGDFATPRSDERRLLLAYDRSLTGLSYHAEGARGTVNSFASRNRIRQVVDEVQGRGLSGPYFLSRPTAVVNSERVEIITRDRNQPSVILKSQPMTRFEEYTVEPLTGRLLFRAPVPSMDANLNPVTIRVSYEVEQGGGEFMTYGGDATLRMTSRLEVSGFAVRDENPLDRQTMLGVSASAKVDDQTTVVGEFARTDAGGSDPAGAAWRVEMRHQSARLEGRIFAISGDTAFANRSSTFVGGRNEFGARWSATLGRRTRLIGEVLRTEDTRTDGRRDGALVGLERRLSNSLVAEIGYRYANQDGANVSPVLGGGLGNSLTGGTSSIPSTLAPVVFSAARARLTARVPGSTRSSIFAEYEYGVDASQARRGSIGGEHLLFDKARLYLRHEWLSSQQGPYALTDGKDQQNTVFGIDANYLRSSQVFSEYRARDAFNGRDAEASMGLRNRWALKPGLLANTSFERVTPLAGTTSSTAFAATGAVEWTKAALWKSTARVEWRTSPVGDNLLASVGYARKLSRDWSMLGRSLYDQVSGGAARGRSQLGLAWRQTDRNRVNALFRIENRLDRTDALGAPTTRTLSNIAAALVNMQATPRLTFSTRYAAKFASDERENVTTKTQAQLLMGRTTYDVSRRVDLGVIGSVMGSGSFGQRRYGAGGELGVVVMRNMRLATGYNLFGFTDRDFQSLGYTQRGVYVDIGFKFDEALFSRSRQNQGAAR